MINHIDTHSKDTFFHEQNQQKCKAKLASRITNWNPEASNYQNLNHTTTEKERERKVEHKNLRFLAKQVEKAKQNMRSHDWRRRRRNLDIWAAISLFCVFAFECTLSLFLSLSKASYGPSLQIAILLSYCCL